jgi:hypothetical protein
MKKSSPFGKMAHTTSGQVNMGDYHGSGLKNKMAKTVQDNMNPIKKPLKNSKITLA